MDENKPDAEDTDALVAKAEAHEAGMLDALERAYPNGLNA